MKKTNILIITFLFGIHIYSQTEKYYDTTYIIKKARALCLLPIIQNDSIIESRYHVQTCISEFLPFKPTAHSVLIIRIKDTFSELKQDYTLCYDFNVPGEIYKIFGFEKNHEEYQKKIIALMKKKPYILGEIGYRNDGVNIDELKKKVWINIYRKRYGTFIKQAF